MEYSIVAAILLVFLLLYFKLANQLNIVDRPNFRSAHQDVTIRGGGIIYPFTFILLLIYNVFNSHWDFSSKYTVLGIGMLLLCSVSFIDDIKDLSSKVRLIFQFLSVIPLMYFIGLFDTISYYYLPIIFIIIIGILNAYNFMDGINGMSGLYSVITLMTLWYVNESLFPFIDAELIIYPIIASLIFLFFNFRTKAVCFMGDVGSMGIAFWLISIIGTLIVLTQDIKWILLLTVYGVETVFTIIERLRLKENILEAHRRHIYQLLVNDLKVPHLLVSALYSVVQLLITWVVIFSEINSCILVTFVIVLTGSVYLFVKKSVKRKIANESN